MAVKRKPTIKATFETGDRPTQAEFGDFIDSYVPIETDGAVGFMEVISTASSLARPSETLVAIATGAQGGKVGVIEVLATADVTALPAGAVGREVLSAAATASAQGHLGGGTVGIQVFEADTTAAAQDILGIVTASETNFGIVEIATQAEMEAGTATDRAVTAANLTDAMELRTPVALTSGTSHDETGIKAGAKRITINYQGLSTDGTSIPMVQLGDSGGIEASNYLGTTGELDASPATTNLTTGFLLTNSWGATAVAHGSLVLTLLDETNNIWVATGKAGFSDTFAIVGAVAGSKALSSTLTQVRLTTVNGTDAFDAGSFSVMIE